ncbi:MAG: hypothetical protein H7Z14_12210 [Anaerolineae bacterium]|nr:hypothetical protein [Phycisphaerae bacterium]
MRRSQRYNKLSLALFVNAVALCLIALALFTKNDSKFPSMIPAAYGQNGQAAIGGGAGVFVVPAQFGQNFYGCYIMDVDAQTICAYQMFPGEHNFRLIAARSFRYDRRLNNYNTATPSPAEVKALVEKEQADVRAADQKRPPASPEAPNSDR